jgi:wobble nucleotide-excising tRNase
MANVAYLIKTSGENSEEFFEANNTIPLFWFNLLNLNVIKNARKNLVKSFNNEDEEYFTIKLSKTVFMKNLYLGKSFIENNYDNKKDLYNEFINYLDKKFNEMDILELNILEIANFFDSMENLVGDITNIIKNINSNINKLIPFEPGENIFSFVGYDGFFGNEFANYSKEYREYCTNEIKENKEKIEKDNFKKKVYEIKEKISNIIMCIGGTMFIGLCIFGIIKSGNYLMGIMGISLGLVSLIIGILKIKGII